MSLGFEQAGFDIAAAVEIDPIHCATHKFNFPLTKTICADVIKMTGTDIRRRTGLDDTEVDVLFGGAPCQGFSLIGKRALDDPRNQLVFHYVRILSELKPKYFVFENVRGLMLGKHATFLDELIEALCDAGYRVTSPYQVLNAAHFGVPQDRRRLFVIGARNDMKLPKYPKAIEQETTVWDAIGDLPDADLFSELISSDAVRTKWESNGTYAKKLRGLVPDSYDFAYKRKYDTDILTSSLRTAHTEISIKRFSATPHGKVEPVSHFRKLPPDGLCNTLRAGTDSARGAFTSPRPIHPSFPRVITVREAARLHSYPDWFRFHVTKWHGFRQIGNSVPPLLARAVANQIVKALEYNPKKPQAMLDLGDPILLSYDMGSAARYFGVPHDTIPQRTRGKNSANLDLWKEAYG